MYSPKEVCAQLRIGDSTLRKWVGYIQRQNYQFVVDQHGHRTYNEKDIEVFRQMQELLGSNHTLEEAAKKAVWKTPQNGRNAESAKNTDMKNVLDGTEGTPITPALYQKMASMLEEQAELNRTLVTRLERIEERAEQRDQVLMQVMRQMQENAKKEIAAAEEQKKKKRWFGLF